MNQPLRGPSASATMTDLSISDLLVRAAALAFVGGLLYLFFLHRSYDFAVRVRNRRIEYRGRFPRAQQQALAEFLLKDLSVHDSLAIMGAHQGKRLVLWFRGSLTEGDKQRIRNFLVSRM
jgi:hypothetical protein